MLNLSIPQWIVSEPPLQGGSALDGAHAYNGRLKEIHFLPTLHQLPVELSMPNKITNLQLVEALRYPSAVMRNEVPFDTCEYGGTFQPEADDCHGCLNAPECEWVLRNDDPANLSSMPRSQLLALLRFASDYIHSRLKVNLHDPQACDCNGCNWWRLAQHLLPDTPSETSA